MIGGRIHFILAAFITFYAVAVPAEEVDWKKGKLEHLAPAIGTYRLNDVLFDPYVVAELEKLLPADAVTALHENLQVAGPVDFIDGHLVLSGNRPHHGTEDTASLWIRIFDGAVYVILQRQSKTTLYARAEKFQYLPKSLRALLATPLEQIPWRAPPPDVTWVGQVPAP